jgi:hypothetical protein
MDDSAANVASRSPDVPMLNPFRSLLRLGLVLLASIASLGGPSALGQSDPIVERGVQYLKGAFGAGQTGETALMALALIKAEVPATDVSLKRAIGVIMKRFSESSYSPERTGGSEIYEASVIILALANLDPSEFRPQVQAAARYILSRQNGNGSWDYWGRVNGDSSISQYAVLGLWEAENAGMVIPPSVWDRAAQFYLLTQSAAGGWTYHRDDGGLDTISMTAAGVGSLLICQRQLAPYRAMVKVAHPLLIPLDLEGDRKRYQPEVASRRIDQAAQAGINWLGSNFATNNNALIGHSIYYALYGIERMGALADKATLGRRDWYAEGRAFLASSQGPGGNFTGSFGDGPNTAWAVLFLVKATAKTLHKIQLRRLGAGTLIGGRGLPKDLSQISVAGGHVIARPMDGAVEEMLGTLEDPRVMDASSALAGLVAKYRTEGPKALKPFQDRFRKLLTDPDQGIRRVAAWSLARTGDLAMALPLMDALKDPDDGVVTEARRGLELLSRKIEGFGPPASASPEQREAAILKWKDWYEAVRPLAVSAEEGQADPATKAAASPPRRIP